MLPIDRRTRAPAPYRLDQGMKRRNQDLIERAQTSAVSTARTFFTTFREMRLRAISGESLRTGIRDRKKMLMRFMVGKSLWETTNVGRNYIQWQRAWSIAAALSLGWQ